MHNVERGLQRMSQLIRKARGLRPLQLIGAENTDPEAIRLTYRNLDRPIRELRTMLKLHECCDSPRVVIDQMTCELIVQYHLGVKAGYQKAIQDMKCQNK